MNRFIGAKKLRPSKRLSRVPTECAVPSSIWRGVMPETNPKKCEKNNQKTTSLGLREGEMRLNSRDPQKAQLGHLLSRFLGQEKKTPPYHLS